MEQRIQIESIQPNAFQGMFALENYLKGSDLSKIHKELIKLRASQINKCSFCLNMHTKEALHIGETKERIFLLSAWKDGETFTKEEKVILQMTEDITLIHENGLSSNTYKEAISLFGESYTCQIIIAITTINSWNRIAVSTNMPF
ncbi:alkylhydroperoxidase AhpD family core domain-containing protein [Tenacibaculum sp. MAR_2009_124]|uniref:carboxymuconolactone decarboxylase family protein n=1 Tax=Tenacibaculum sp. MAR_2009_124 TaxID=1250059 RepID=UPI000897BF46|nr:carboxymuconolactone decarboxylase family protein [Tenacibaculum sp. MAR_2009_124]SEC77379.1 alkylhydroperoxidase AhpD family core domain-containing protein [Tenacibaculum sp. MAR_2009_124]